MGSIVTAACRCGFEAEALVGGGMRNFTTTCYFPCLCEVCQTFAAVNLLAETKECPRCKRQSLIPYDDPRLIASPGQHTVADWNVHDLLGRRLLLTDGKYRCPACREMSLEFRARGVWD